MLGDPCSLVQLAQACERIRQAGGTSAKVGIAADQLRLMAQSPGLEPLRTGCCLLMGQPLPPSDPRTLKVGGAVVRQVAVELLDLDAELFRDCARACGESAEAFALLRAGQPDRVSDLSIPAVRELFERLARARQPIRRVALLCDALRDAHPLVCKVLLKVIAGGMRIGLSALLLEQALAKALDTPLPEVRRAALLCGDLTHVAQMARAGQAHAVTHRLFTPLAFMLAGSLEPGDPLPEGDWRCEDKFDGIRVQVHHAGDVSRDPASREGEGAVALSAPSRLMDVEPSEFLFSMDPPQTTRVFSRGGDDITTSFPEIVTAMSTVPGRLVVDGEALACDDAGAPLPFGVLQRRLGRRSPSAALRAEAPVRLVAYDLLVREDELLIDLPLEERQRRLAQLPFPPEVLRSLSLPLAEAAAQAERLVGPEAPIPPPCPAKSDPLPPPPSHPPAVSTCYRAARRRGHEGLMLKRAEGSYEPGKRSSTWLKVKRPAATLDVVVTAAEMGHGRRQSVLSDLTFAVYDPSSGVPPGALADRPLALGDRPAFVNVGKAYSGLTDREIELMTQQLNKLTVRRAGRMRLVQPRIVLEVAFDGIQLSPRHRSGFALRFPRISRWRTDKTASEVDSVDRVRQLYELGLRRSAPSDG